MAQHRSELDQHWAGLADCIRADPERVTRLVPILGSADPTELRQLPNKDMMLVGALAFAALQEGLLQAAEATGD